MRCSLRSTTCRGSVTALLALLVGVAAPARGAVPEADVEQAIVSAVARQVGASAKIGIRDLQVRLGAEVEGSVFATLGADARAGQPTRVVLKVMRRDGRASRFGEATCTIDVTVPGVRARRAITRGEQLAADDVGREDVAITGWILRALPVDVDGARAVLDVPAGQVLQSSMLQPAPLVKAGEPVTIAVVSGPLRVETRGIASQPGRLNDVVRVLNPESGRRVTGRVVGPGVVEVRHGS